MSRRGAILQGSFLGVLQSGLRLAIGLVSVPLTLNYLGAERYGLWMTALSINAVFTFFDLGLTPTLMNRMAEAHGRCNREAFQRFSSAGVVVGAGLLAVGATFALVVLALPWDNLLHIREPQAVREAPVLVAVLIGCATAGAALGCIESIFMARMKLVRPRLYAVGAALVSFILLLVGVHLRVSLPLLAFLTGSTSVIYRLPLLAELLVREPALLVPRLPELRGLLAELLPVSLLFLGIQASAVVLSSLPNVILACVRSLADVANFSVASRVVNIPLLAVAAVLPVVWPAFTVAWSCGERNWLQRRLRLALQTTAAAMALFGVVAVLVGPQAIRWWTHGKADVSPPVLATLSAWLVVQALVHWLSTFLHSITDFRFELVCYSGSAVLFVALASVFTPRFGAAGMGAAMCAALLFGSLFPMAARVRRKLT